MEIDLAQLDSVSRMSGDSLYAPVCIIGAGIAGLTLAHKLIQLGHEVLVLESGAQKPQFFGAVEQTGHVHPGTSEPRLRTLGGTSLSWGGQLLPLPPESRWPISAEVLHPFSAEAEDLLAVDTLPCDAPQFFAALRQPTPRLLAGLSEVDCVVSKFAPFFQRNLSHSLGRELRSHARARVVQNAHATELKLTPAADSIRAVVVRTPEGRTVPVHADQFIVAAGTIESVRLLLASRSVRPKGVGNEEDQLGRNFHDHLTVTAATLREPARSFFLAQLRPWIHGSTVHSLKLCASGELRRQRRMTDVMAHMTLHEPEDSGIGAIRGMLRARQQQRASTRARMLRQLPAAVADAARLTLSARAKHRRYVSSRAAVELRLNAAQRTPSSSRITLSNELQPVLDWRIDAAELATLRLFARHLRSQLANDGMEWNPSLIEDDLSAPIPALDDARHAMGGACMGTDPAASVVNADLRVHGVRNLFVASAAVFPDGSPQLPTLPLMALALRLAQHLHDGIL
jgi:choline dehydrogenase-like flavoprotein